MNAPRLSVAALGPTISAQLSAQGFQTSMPADKVDRLEHAIHILRIHEMLTHEESDRAIKRLIKELRVTKA